MKSVLLGLLLIIAWPVRCESNRPKAGIFVFGDSLFDPGNQNYRNVSILDKANYWPYGETFFNYSTGRFCNGRIVPDLIATEANLPLWKPYLGNESQNFSHGANFASSSAGVLPETDFEAINLEMQFSFLKEVASQIKDEIGEKEGNRMLMESVYMFSIGGDDYSYFYGNYPDATESQTIEFVNMVIGNLTQVIKGIYDIGGRKFAFQNVGPMGCLPVAKALYGVTGDDCVEQLLELARMHNQFLSETVDGLESQLQGFRYVVFDYYTTLYDIIHYPSKYDFNVSDAACCDGLTHCGIEPYETCKNVTEYVFWDKAHPTEATNLLLSNLMWSGNSSYVVPYNLQQLLHLQNTTSNFPSDYHVSNPIKNKRAMVGFTANKL